MRDNVIDLQQAPLAAAPPVVCAICAAALVAHVYFARDSGCNMAIALYLFGCFEAVRRLRRWSFRYCLWLTRRRANAPRLPAHTKPLFQQLAAQRFEPALHHAHQIALGLGVAEQGAHLL